MAKVIYDANAECKHAKFVGIFFEESETAKLSKYLGTAIGKLNSEERRKDKNYSKVYLRLSAVSKNIPKIDVKKSDLGKTVSVDVIGYGENKSLQVIYVKLPSGIKSLNEHPHILMSYKPHVNRSIPNLLYKNVFVDAKNDYSKLKEGDAIVLDDQYGTKFFKKTGVTLKGKIGAFCTETLNNNIVKREKKMISQEQTFARKMARTKRKTSRKKKVSRKTLRKKKVSRKKTSRKKKVSRKKTSRKRKVSRKKASRKRKVSRKTSKRKSSRHKTA